MIEYQGTPYSWGSGPGWCEMYLQAWLEYDGMTEKKTYSNPEGMAVYQDGSIWVTDDNSTYNYDEWDMEVVFTKRPKLPKFKPGDRVDTYDHIDGTLSGDEGTVVIQKEPGKVRVVWDVQPDYIGTWDEGSLVAVP